MTRALDGSYYKLKWLDSCGDKCIGCHKYDKEGAAREIAARKDWSLWGNTRISIVRIRPRMSIARAVRLLTEARKQGVELWMQRVNVAWWVRVDECGSFEEEDTYNGWYDAGAFTASHIQDKWIVATPEDARKIDARGKK